MVKSKSTRLGDWIVVFLCVLLILACLLPILNVLSRSLSRPDALVRNEVSFWPVGLNLSAYQTVLGNSTYTWALIWTAILTVIFTVLAMIMTVMCAYPLIYENLKGRGIMNVMIVITMYFNAGTIPTFVLYNRLNLISNPLVLILPGCLSVFNMIIMRSFFYGIPDSLRECTELDGAGPLRILISIYLPLSKPVLATLALFYAVQRWNGFSDALMFMRNRTYYPIQLLLFNILNNISSIDIPSQDGGLAVGIPLTFQAAVVMFATIPILLIYPWLQRYFITGVTLGAVKE